MPFRNGFLVTEGFLNGRITPEVFARVLASDEVRRRKKALWRSLVADKLKLSDALFQVLTLVSIFEMLEQDAVMTGLDLYFFERTIMDLQDWLPLLPTEQKPDFEELIAKLQVITDRTRPTRLRMAELMARPADSVIEASC